MPQALMTDMAAAFQPTDSTAWKFHFKNFQAGGGTQLDEVG